MRGGGDLVATPFGFDSTAAEVAPRRVPDPVRDLSAVLDAAPPRFATAPESALAGQLATARQIIDAIEAHPPTEPLRDPAVSEDFQRVRWFTLPGERLTQLLASRG
jgi:hypothetical protein